jgi:hypothetical protein
MCFFKDENGGIFDDDIEEDSRGQTTLMRLKENNIESAINNWASSWSEIETKTLKNTWKKLISNEEPESDLEGTEDDVHGAFGADPSDDRDWINKDEEDFGYQNLTEEETEQQVEEDCLSEEDEEGEKREETRTKFKFSKMKQNVDSIVNFVDSNSQYNEYYLILREMRQDVVKEQNKRGIQTKIS